MHYVSEYRSAENYDYQVQDNDSNSQSTNKKKRPRLYCRDFINEHDVDDRERPLAHIPGTVQAGFVNPLGVRLSETQQRDMQAPSVFRPFEKATCEICWRIDFAPNSMSPTDLRRHIRQLHGKEPEARDAHTSMTRHTTCSTGS